MDIHRYIYMYIYLNKCLLYERGPLTFYSGNAGGAQKGPQHPSRTHTHTHTCAGLRCHGGPTDETSPQENSEKE